MLKKWSDGNIFSSIYPYLFVWAGISLFFKSKKTLSFRRISPFCYPTDKDFFESFATSYGIDLKGKTILTALGRPVKRKGFSWFIENVLPKLEGNFVLLIIGPFDKTRS